MSSLDWTYGEPSGPPQRKHPIIICIHFTSNSILNHFVKNAHSFEHCTNHKIIEKMIVLVNLIPIGTPLKWFCAYESCIEMDGWAFTSWPCTLKNTLLKWMGLTWMHACTNLLKWIRGGVRDQESAKYHSNYCTILSIAFDIILEYHLNLIAFLSCSCVEFLTRLFTL